MRVITVGVAVSGLFNDRPGKFCLKQLAECRDVEHFGHAFVRALSLKSKPDFETAHVGTTWSFPTHHQTLPGSMPVFFLAWSSTNLLAPENLEKRREPVANDTAHVENDTAHFHDSESGDIYDLFNACNGIVREGLLDVEQLNNYTPAEAEELNISRLREIWEHTKTGCLHCRDIVKALRMLRRTVSNVADDIRSHDDQDSDADINHISSIS
jgi:hypothetical protein